MGIAKMNKVYLIAHQAEKDKVLAVLQQLGVMEVNDLQSKDVVNEAWAELVESDQEQEALQALESRLADVRFALDFLNRYYPAKKGLLDALNGTKVSFGANELSGNADQWAEHSQEAYAALRKIDEKLMALRNEETRLQNLKLQLSPWAKFTLPFEEVKATATTRAELGVLPAAEVAPAKEDLASAVSAFFLEEINVDRGEAYVFLAYHTDSAEEVQAVLKKHNFSKQPFPQLNGTPAENLSRIEKELVQAEEDRKAALASAEEQVKNRDYLNYYFDYLTVEREKKQVVSNFARTGNAFILEGWLREADVPALRNRLETACETVELVAREPEAGESFPVALENKRFFAPFEFITKLYGTPSPHGLDPTPALTPFFIMFFGLCMTDAGYGVVIALIAGLGLLKIKGSGSVRGLLWVLFAAGLSTILFGWLLGGWFGLQVLGAPFYFDSLADPMRMLIIALALGVVQIFFGMAIQAWRNIKAGKPLDAIFDQGLWYALIIGLLLFALDMPGLGKALSIVGAVGLVLTQGRTQPTLIKKFLSGLLSLYNITGYLSDVLSYSRLLALGLATAVIALAINTMAALLAGSVIGYIVMVGLLIGGHAFNLTINTLGSYIHSSRLQYIEFYNRFYEGGGRTFVPFQLKTRNIEIKPEWEQS